MDTRVEYTIDLYHVESSNGRLGPYRCYPVRAENFAVHFVCDSVFGETVGKSRSYALYDLIRGWLFSDKEFMAKAEEKFGGLSDEFYDCAQRIDSFITDKSISVVCDKAVALDTKAFNEAVFAEMIESPHLLNQIENDFQSHGSTYHCWNFWLKMNNITDVNWNSYVNNDYDWIFKHVASALRGGPDSFEPFHKFKYLKDYLLGPGGEPIRAEFTAAVQSVHRATQGNQISPSTTSASPNTGKISQEQMFAMMLAPYGRCPKCNYPLSSRKVGLNAKKAALGGILAGPVGAIVGASSGKEELYCKNCGYIS